MKFKSKVFEVEATQYVMGEVVEGIYLTVTDHVDMKAMVRNCSPYDGMDTEILPGQWLIQGPERTRSIMSDEDFKNCYEPVEENSVRTTSYLTVQELSEVFEGMNSAKDLMESKFSEDYAGKSLSRTVEKFLQEIGPIGMYIILTAKASLLLEQIQKLKTRGTSTILQ